MASVVLFVFCSSLMMPFIPDDAFVSFRYAENLIEGRGLAFNEDGKPIEGYSNFLWVLVCALVFKLGFELPAAMPWVGILFGVLSVVVLAEFYRRRGIAASSVFLPLFIFATAAPFVIHSIASMEVPLFALLLLMLLLTTDVVNSNNRMAPYIALAAIGALLALCRPEGLIAFPVIVVADIVLSRKRGRAARDASTRVPLLAAVVIFVLAVTAYHVWRVSYFGAAIPPSFAARLGGGEIIYHAWFENLRMYFISQGSDHLPSGYFITLLVICAIVGASMSKSEANQRRTEHTALWLFGVFALIYFNFVDRMPGMRYHAPLLGLLFVPGVYLQSRAMAALALTKTTVGRVKLVSTVLVVLAVSFSWLAFLKMGITRAETGNQKSSVALAEWLVKALPAGARLAVNESGIIPYHTGFHTVDIAPIPVTGTHPGKGWWNDWFFESKDAKPDVVVITGRGIFYATMDPDHYDLATSSRFNEIYRLLGVVRYNWFEDQSYWVYIPHNLPPFTKELLDEFPVGIGSVKRLYRESNVCIESRAHRGSSQSDAQNRYIIPGVVWPAKLAARLNERITDLFA
ncbi:MAG: hypothetical protein JSW50_13710 [Candidatus Latescibacterota bacterium]|nr:MAG: hypothetical protein JSW50_13710 [Candidatus Latescibacterota bacterium]